VCVEHEDQACSLLHDANASVRAAVDTTLVALGQAEGSRSSDGDEDIDSRS